MAWLFLSVLMCLLYLFKIEERKPEDGMVTITAIVYIGFFSYHAVLTEYSYSGLCKASPVWLILITAFCTDIFAYFGGYFLGKHKLCPVISPKKTVEGSVCGKSGKSDVFPAVRLVLYGSFFALGLWSHPEFWEASHRSSEILTASIFKRKMGIKDYGTLSTGTRRHHGPVRQRPVYRAYRLLLSVFPVSVRKIDRTEIFMKSISILGSTGSIGTQTLKIIRENPRKYRVLCGILQIEYRTAEGSDSRVPGS